MFSKNLSMSREEAISHIENLFPADSGYDGTAEIGSDLLMQAKRECMISWRDEPTEVLVRYAELCLRLESA